jgi:truncated hemoglobin YjbI
MTRTILVTVAALTAVVLGLGGCGGTTSTMGSAMSLYDQVGGKEAVSKMASSLVNSSMKDPRLSGLLGNVNPTAASSKVSDQMCAALGGGCAAPYTEQQVAAAADKLTPVQKTAVSENFNSSLSSLTSNPALRDAVTKSPGSRMGGILAGL